MFGGGLVLRYLSSAGKLSLFETIAAGFILLLLAIKFLHDTLRFSMGKEPDNISMSTSEESQKDYGDPLWAWTAWEITFQILGIVILAGSIFGYTSVFSTFSTDIRLGVVLALAVNLSLPLIVYIDMRRNMAEPKHLWIHATAMPFLNVIGFLAYLEARNRLFEGNGS